MPLKVIDKTGRLSKNPKDWPADLKRAIAECCCGDESSSSSSTATKHTLSCCRKLVGDLCVTIVGEGIYAAPGTYRMRYFENELVHETGNLFQCVNVNQIYKNGWFSDWFRPCGQTEGNEMRLAIFDEWMPGNLGGCVPGYVLRGTGTLGNCSLSSRTANNNGQSVFAFNASCPPLPGDGITFQCDPFVLVNTGWFFGCTQLCVHASMIVTEC